MVELRLAIKDRIGLLKDVSEIVADFKINMKSITSETKNRLYPLIVIHAPFKNKEQLEKMMVKMKNITGVEEVSYTFIN